MKLNHAIMKKQTLGCFFMLHLIAHTTKHGHQKVSIRTVDIDVVVSRPVLEGGQGRPWPPQLFITPSTIEKIKPSEIIRVTFINYGRQLVLDDVSRSVSSSNKVCFQNGRLDPKLTITSGVYLKSLSFCTMTSPDNDAVFGTRGSIQAVQQ